MQDGLIYCRAENEYDQQVTKWQPDEDKKTKYSTTCELPRTDDIQLDPGLDSTGESIVYDQSVLHQQKYADRC